MQVCMTTIACKSGSDSAQSTLLAARWEMYNCLQVGEKEEINALHTDEGELRGEIQVCY